MLRRMILLPILQMLVVAIVAQARPAIPQPQPSRLYDWRWYSKNQWNIAVTNYASFGNGIGRSGGEWPAGSGDMYIYGAGIWIGCIKRGEGFKDTLVSVGYNPNSGTSEMSPGAYDNAPGGYGARTFERVYITPDFPPDPLDFPEVMQDSVLTPIKVPRGSDTLRSWFHYVPRTAVSTGDAWAVFNDLDPERHTSGRTPRPMGIEVYQSIYSWTLPWNKDIVFFKLDVRNRSSDTLKDLYLAIGADPDVGNAADDRAGLCLHKWVHSPTRAESAYADNLGYVYSEDRSPSGFVGFDFLQSPFVRNPDGTIDGINGVDDNGNGLIDEPSEGRQVGMSAFKIFILANDPKTDGEQYLGMAGWDWTENPPVRAPYDSIDATPDDKRFLQATGPVTLAPGELTTVTCAVIGANRPASGEASPYYLAVASQAAQQAYDNNWIMPEPPPAPSVTVIPGDGRVTLIWDDLPESAVDRFFPLAPTLSNPYYAERDFQGYKVYRSRSGQPGDWMLLGQCDRKDGIVFEDTTVVESLRTSAKDVGLRYSFVDSSDLRLGFPYYYAVTSFDINYLGDDTVRRGPTDTLSLESGLTGIRAVPRTAAHGYRPPGADWLQVAGNARLRLKVEPFSVAPYAVKADTYHVQFLYTTYDASLRQPRYRFLVTRSNGDTVVGLTSFPVKIDAKVDTTRLVATVFDWVITNIKQRNDSLFDTTRQWMPVVQLTMKLQTDSIPYQFYRDVTVSGAYPADSVRLRDDGANNRGHWAYRGSNYRVVFKSRGSGLTAEVRDVENDLAVPYRYLKSLTTPQWADSADGWCFQTLTDAADTLAVGRTVWMYVCGARLKFRPGDLPMTQLPANGDTWYLNTQTLSPVPYAAAYRVWFVPQEYRADAGELDVKVVPNPYLVRNEWERHKDFRKVKFINLPQHCDIYIYNLAGDLIRVLRHDDTRPDAGGVPGQYGGDEDWDLLNQSRQKPAPGVYVFHVESDDGRKQSGKFVLIF